MRKIYSLILIFICTISFGQSYLGKITKQVNFRYGPSTESEILYSLKKDQDIFIVSLDTENEFYNIIDIKSNTEGYVHKSFVRIGNLVSKSKESVFTPSGKISNFNSEIKIFNDTSKSLTLKLNDEYFYFGPFETKNISLNPGEYDFRASAPGVIPYIGTEKLNSNQGYSWKFYIVISYR
jgi:hypothetical protein